MNVGKVGAPFKYPHSYIANLKDTRVFLQLWNIGRGFCFLDNYGV